VKLRGRSTIIRRRSTWLAELALDGSHMRRGVDARGMPRYLTPPGLTATTLLRVTRQGQKLERAIDAHSCASRLHPSVRQFSCIDRAQAECLVPIL
jgi:hypothetical protein